MSTDIEAEVIVNGQRLTQGQSMTIRVALNTFAMDLREKCLGNDPRGKAIAKAYQARLSELFSLFHGKETKKT